MEVLFKTIAAAVALWALWRFWRFTLRPSFLPNEPAELPYAIPWIGSAFSFFSNSGATIYSGLKDRARPIFTLTLAGESIYVVTNPKDVSAVYRNTTSLAFDSFIADLMLACGASPSTVQKMCQQPPPYLPNTKVTGLNKRNKSLVNVAIDFHHRQLLPGPGSHEEDITHAFTCLIRCLLAWDKISVKPRFTTLRADEGVETSLLDFCGTVLIEAGVKTYWGVRLWEADSNALQTFYDLDDGIWKILFLYPRILSQEVVAVRDRIIQQIAQYYRLPFQERQDVAWFTKAMEEESRAAGLDEDEMAACIMIIYFVINGNTYKFCFWALCHILTDPLLHDQILDEINADTAAGDPSVSHLTRNCPVLDATLREVLRLYTSSASMRLVLDDTLVNGTLLRKGRKVMIPYRQLHENPDVWGPHALKFDAHRFRANSSLIRNSSYRPFGGGATLCAGRFVALAEVVTFIGVALKRYNISLRPGVTQEFPRPDTRKPTFGMMSPKGSDDFVIRISAKESICNSRLAK